MWRKKDSDNLESIAKSLEKLVEREQEREIVNNTGLIENAKRLFLQKNQIKITDGLNPEFVEDEALEEDLKTAQRMNNKISDAQRSGNTPFWAEDLFNDEELETLES